MSKTFAVSQQHYLFGVQSFATCVLDNSEDEYALALRDRTTRGVIKDVAAGVSELGVLFETSESKEALDAAIKEAGLQFVKIADSVPQVALPKAHPLTDKEKIAISDLVDYPYVYFEQEDDDPKFAEEALAEAPHHKRIATTDRATLSELICAVNGYTITSGILVGVTDGSLLATVPLETDVVLELGCVVKGGLSDLSELGQRFIQVLTKNLSRYAVK